jgi:hypothetical protein
LFILFILLYVGIVEMLQTLANNEKENHNASAQHTKVQHSRSLVTAVVDVDLKRFAGVDPLLHSYVFRPCTLAEFLL